jgi:hypothetical protein
VRLSLVKNVRKLHTQKMQTRKAAMARGCTEFFIGWLKRFGSTMNLFVFPLNKKERPNL